MSDPIRLEDTNSVETWETRICFISSDSTGSHQWTAWSPVTDYTAAIEFIHRNARDPRFVIAEMRYSQVTGVHNAADMVRCQQPGSHS